MREGKLCPECTTVYMGALLNEQDMEEKGRMEVGNCPDGCCPTFFVIWQCPKCKVVECDTI